jgi:predicted nuclease of predicted toxin-antitoxin system
MRFIADIGISPSSVAALRAHGHEATHLSEIGLERAADAEILDKAHAEQAIVLTHDLDFGELMAASGALLPSVIIFRLPDMRPANVTRHLLAIIAQHSAALEQGAILSVSERRVRVRRLPVR